MIRLPKTIYIATAPVNLHFSFDRLAGIVRTELGDDPKSDAAFVFYNRRRTHVKILLHQERGYWLLYKRLDRGTYRIPLTIPSGATSVRMSHRELRVLLKGIDRTLLYRARNHAKPKCTF